MQRDLLARSRTQNSGAQEGGGIRTSCHASSEKWEEVGISPPLRSAVTFIRTRCSVRPGGATNPWARTRTRQDQEPVDPPPPPPSTDGDKRGLKSPFMFSITSASYVQS